MNLPGPVPLAIVIPAYKTRFLGETLASIAAQSNRNFKLYIGDDCSPEPVADVVRQFTDKMDITYHRFDTNLGGVSLTRHWERCLRLSAEPWLWCFGDDDCMEPGCVDAFFAELEKTGAGHDLYRFNTRWINGAGETISESPAHPLEETGGDFLEARLRGARNSTLQELIFSRHAWETSGGIPDFPLAWASDDAFIARLGVRRLIRTIFGPCVRWRLSDANISNSGSPAAAAGKIRASMEFVRWIIDYFENYAKPMKTGIVPLTEQWFNSYVTHFEKFLGWRNSVELERLATRAWGHPAGAGLWWALKNNALVASHKFNRKILRRP
jgi:glycosyltransferase involved in cell wall biosynthesis